jgi:hypothetical protein
MKGPADSAIVTRETIILQVVMETRMAGIREAHMIRIVAASAVGIAILTIGIETIGIESIVETTLTDATMESEIGTGKGTEAENMEGHAVRLLHGPHRLRLHQPHLVVQSASHLQLL